VSPLQEIWIASSQTSGTDWSQALKLTRSLDESGTVLHGVSTASIEMNRLLHRLADQITWMESELLDNGIAYQEPASVL
jgi:hypothetical protein